MDTTAMQSDIERMLTELRAELGVVEQGLEERNNRRASLMAQINALETARDCAKVPVPAPTVPAVPAVPGKK